MSEQEQYEVGSEIEEPAASGEATPPTDEDPAERVAAQAKELQALQDRYLRLAAEFDNYRKRVTRERAEVVRTAYEGLLLELLPVLDNLERALAAARAAAAVSGAGNDALIEGVEITLRLFRGLLEKQGVKEIESVGREFDPTIHHAVEQVRTGAYPENTVVEEVLRGYLLDQRVLRPALVKVASAPPGPAEGDGGRG